MKICVSRSTLPEFLGQGISEVVGHVQQIGVQAEDALARRPHYMCQACQLTLSLVPRFALLGTWQFGWYRRCCRLSLRRAAHLERPNRPPIQVLQYRGQ